MICRKCSAQNKEENKECNKCGRYLSEENKVGLILSIVSAGLTMLGFSLFINVLTIVIALIGILFTIINKNKKYKIYNICFSLYAICASIVWMMFIYI